MIEKLSLDKKLKRIHFHFLKINSNGNSRRVTIRTDHRSLRTSSVFRCCQRSNDDDRMTTATRKWGWRALVSSNKSVGSKGAVITHLFVFGDEEEKKWSSWSPLGDWESKRDKRGTNPSTLGHSHSRRTHCCCLSGGSSRFAETVAEEQGRLKSCPVLQWDHDVRAGQQAQDTPGLLEARTDLGNVNGEQNSCSSSTTLQIDVLNEQLCNEIEKIMAGFWLGCCQRLPEEWQKKVVRCVI